MRCIVKMNHALSSAGGLRGEKGRLKKGRRKTAGLSDIIYILKDIT